MIGELLTVTAGIYAGLYLAKKGCSYERAVKPLENAAQMLKSCPCCSKEDNENEKEKEKKNEQS
jgi:ribosomal protein L37AE/L43A